MRLLQAIGALAAVALGAGLPTWVGYNVYANGRPDDHFETVQPGKAGAWQHVAWRVSVQRSNDAKCRSTTPDRVCLKIIVLRAALDQEGAIRHGQPEITTQDAAGRTWKALIDADETPTDTTDNIIGHSYRMDVYSMVPTAVADSVQVLLRPSTYRNVPGQDFDSFLKDIEKSNEKNDHVLRFLREPAD
ncbi:hypothetical protein J5X84_14620 [Streptosporangiaceae bacterium NEAU-GS5]|nr:hypothetical protein [Streptosporangiaceae bacterium NEAU-GS5]